MIQSKPKAMPQRVRLENMPCVFPNAAGLDIGSSEIVAHYLRIAAIAQFAPLQLSQPI